LAPITACKCGCGFLDLEVLLGATATQGGVWSGTGVVGNQIVYDPATITAASGPLVVNVTYSVGDSNLDQDPANGGCFAEQSIDVTILPTPGVDFDFPDGVICTNYNPYTVVEFLTGETTANGELFVDGASVAVGDVAIDAYEIDPATFASGFHSVTYTETVTGALGDCVATQTEIFEIRQGGDPAWENPSPVCFDELPIVLSATTLPAAGILSSWTGAGITDNGDGTADFSPATAGNYTVTYCVGEATCQECLTQIVEVYPLVDATLEDRHLECVVAPGGAIGLEALFSATTTPGGTFTVDGQMSSNQLFYTGPACYLIEYTVSSFDSADPDGGCSDTQSANLYISESPAPSFDLAEELCWDGVTVLTIDPIVNSPMYTTAAVAVWSSSDAGVASVDMNTGTVTAVAEGSTQICWKKPLPTLYVEQWVHKTVYRLLVKH